MICKNNRKCIHWRQYKVSCCKFLFLFIDYQFPEIAWKFTCWGYAFPGAELDPRFHKISLLKFYDPINVANFHSQSQIKLKDQRVKNSGKWNDKICIHTNHSTPIVKNWVSSLWFDFLFLHYYSYTTYICLRGRKDAVNFFCLYDCLP